MGVHILQNCKCVESKMHEAGDLMMNCMSREGGERISKIVNKSVKHWQKQFVL